MGNPLRAPERKAPRSLGSRVRFRAIDLAPVEPGQLDWREIVVSDTLYPVRCVRKTLVCVGDGGDQGNPSQRTLATTSAADAVKKAVEDKKSSTTDRSKLMAKPSIFDYKSQEEEINAFREWPWVLEKHLSAADEALT